MVVGERWWWERDGDGRLMVMGEKWNSVFLYHLIFISEPALLESRRKLVENVSFFSIGDCCHVLLHVFC